MELYKMSAAELSERIKNKEITVREAVDAVFAAIDSRDEKYHCYTSTCREEAYARAEEVQKQIDAGELDWSPSPACP